MKTQRNASRFIAVAVALVLAGCGSGETSSSSLAVDTPAGITVPTTTVPSAESDWTNVPTTTPTTTRPAAQVATTPAYPTTTVPATAPEAARQTYFGLSLPLGTRWAISDMLSNDARKVFVDSDRCGSAAAMAVCPGFAIVNFTRNNDWLPYDNPNPAFAATPEPDGTKCYRNGINNDTYRPIQTVDRVKMGGVEMKHAMQRQCGDAGDIMHSWRDDKRKIVVFDFGLSDSGTAPVEGVEELLRAARW